MSDDTGPYDGDDPLDEVSYDDLDQDLLDGIIDALDDPAGSYRTDLDDVGIGEYLERDVPEVPDDLDRYDLDGSRFQELYADSVRRSGQQPSDVGGLVWEDAAAGDAADFHHEEVEAAYTAGVDAPAVVLLSTFFESYVTAQLESYLSACADDTTEQVTRDLLGASTRFDGFEDGEEVSRAGFSEKIAAARSTGFLDADNADLFELVSWSRNRYTSDGLDYFDPDRETPLQRHDEYGLEDAIGLYESILGLDPEESMLDRPRMEPDCETAAEVHSTTMDVLVEDGHQGAATVLLAGYFESVVTERLEEFWDIDDPSAGTSSIASMPFGAQAEQVRNAALDPDSEFQLLDDPDAMHPARVYQVMTATRDERNRFGHELAAYGPGTDAGLPEDIFEDAKSLYHRLSGQR